MDRPSKPSHLPEIPSSESSPLDSESILSLTEGEWRSQKRAYLACVEPWVQAWQKRATAQIKHPVYDFLFEYYWFRPAHLLRWSPGFHVRLERAKPEDIGWSSLFQFQNETALLPAKRFPAKRIPALTRNIQELELVASREPQFHCLGLHEWAMVYKTSEIRHNKVPLRLEKREIDSVVESQGLRCTHFEAYRFFTEPASPRNRISLTRANTIEHEQPGCIHLNMDLYKCAYSIAPFIKSEIVAEAFEYATAARVIDMRASPYDLRDLGFVPIELETRAGREEYIESQRLLHEKSIPLRVKIIEAYRKLLNAVSK